MRTINKSGMAAATMVQVGEKIQVSPAMYAGIKCVWLADHYVVLCVQTGR
jgi:hypothetical protein